MKIESGDSNRGLIIRMTANLKAPPFSTVRAGFAVILILSCGPGWPDDSVSPDSAGVVETGSTPALADRLDEREERYRELVLEAGQWLQQGQLAQALRVLTQATELLGGRTTVDILFLAAQAHMGLGNREMAARILEKLARGHPQVDRIQLDYAAMLYSMGRDEEADAIFRRVREKKNLPEPVKRNIEGFLERIHRRKSLLVDYELSIWKDKNVNNAAEVDEVDIPLFGGLRFSVNEKPVEAWVVRAGAHLLHRMPLREDGGIRLHTRAGLARNTARNAKEHNRTWMNFSTGPQLYYTMDLAGEMLPGQVGADIGYEKRWRGGDPYSGSAWVRLSARQYLSTRWLAGGYVRYWDTSYSEISSELDPKGQALNLYVERVFQRARMTVGWTVSTEHPDRASQRWKSHQGMLGYETLIGLNWRVSAVATLAENRYKGVDVLFQKRREERHRNFHVTVSNRALSWGGYLPELTFGLTETKSNIDLYDRDNFTIRLNFQKLF